jgi:hypothetical protein
MEGVHIRLSSSEFVPSAPFHLTSKQFRTEEALALSLEPMFVEGQHTLIERNGFPSKEVSSSESKNGSRRFADTVQMVSNPGTKVVLPEGRVRKPVEYWR